jgi:hypothetical protein
MKNLVLLFFMVFASSCQGQECEALPKSFGSYSEALSKITDASFSITDSVDTPSSSWITGANFYSCDKAKGFLIIETSKKNYIFKNVPITVWSNFKNADSYGKFYSKYIRGKFQLAI